VLPWIIPDIPNLAVSFGHASAECLRASVCVRVTIRGTSHLGPFQRGSFRAPVACHVGHVADVARPRGCHVCLSGENSKTPSPGEKGSKVGRAQFSCALCMRPRVPARTRLAYISTCDVPVSACAHRSCPATPVELLLGVCTSRHPSPPFSALAACQHRRIKLYIMYFRYCCGVRLCSSGRSWRPSLPPPATPC
jgi:hypothetical protein